MVTYRWQRRAFGSVLSVLLTILSYELFQAYSTKVHSYFIYGCLTFLFAVCSVCLGVSTLYYVLRRIKLAPKKFI